MAVFDLWPGDAPLIISVPHAGLKIPSAIAERMTDTGLANADADWHVDRLYSFAQNMGVSMLKGRYSRYVIDLNRPPEGGPLYDGHVDTGLCPTHAFDGSPIYQQGAEPSHGEIQARKVKYWDPYHAALQAEIDRLRAEHGTVVLFEAHSIKSQVPRLFDGHLPQMCFGTNDGHSASAELTAAIMEFVREETDYRCVLNDRFKGGYITRKYGAPERGVHAVQLELSQATYLKEDQIDGENGPSFNTSKALTLEPFLKSLVEFMLETETHKR